MCSFFNDEGASIEIPLRLMVYVILTAAIVAVTVIGFSHVWPGMTADTMEKQIGEIQVSLNNIQNGAARNLIDPESPQGTIRTLKITIPENVNYLAFGVDPDPDNDANLTNTPDGILTEGGNVIFYSGVGGKIRIPLDERIQLREGRLEDGRWVINTIGGKQYGAVISDSGNYEITFEKVYDPIIKGEFTLIHMTDNVNAFINPYDPTILPNNIWISVNPASIPADGITHTDILIKLKDKTGRDAPVDGVSINLSASLGNISGSEFTTIKGKATAMLSSDMAGTSLITATSPGLNPGSAHVTVTQKPIIFEFNQWINDEDEKLNGNFSLNQELNWSISFTGYGSKFSIPFIGVWWPNASIQIDGTHLGEEMMDSESKITRTFLQTTLLSAGTHNITISLKNDKYLPLIGDTNLFVDRVVLTG